jgi:GNAT superfamily N-acetyltransferase
MSRQRRVEIPEATLFLRDFCTVPFVEALKPDAGLCAFARLPEREHQLLKKIAGQPASILTLAYTQQRVIVGQVTLVPADSSWQGLANTYEIAFEVSPGWRRRGLARQLLNLVFELDCLDDLIIIGMGLSWHWDTDGLGLTPFAYRAMLARLFAHYGFTEYLTSERNTRMDPANIFLARLGRRVTAASISQFYDRLLQTDTLPGM